MSAPVLGLPRAHECCMEREPAVDGAAEQESPGAAQVKQGLGQLTLETPGAKGARRDAKNPRAKNKVSPLATATPSLPLCACMQHLLDYTVRELDCCRHLAEATAGYRLERSVAPSFGWDSCSIGDDMRSSHSHAALMFDLCPTMPQIGDVKK